MSWSFTEATLEQILKAREERVLLQQHLIQTYHCPLICFTMNIAGPVKTSPLIERGFQEGMKLLAQKLPKDAVQKHCIDISVTGCQAMYAVNADAAKLKQICVSIEESTPLGRLFDMDVLDTNGIKLERSNPRNCIVCNAAGRVCAAGRIHSVSQLQDTTAQILIEHFSKTDAEHFAALAVQSLIDEVNTTPKPGLVDRRNSGSHSDMNINHFMLSANSLKFYFKECFQIGQKSANLTPQETFPLLQQAGIRAENAMYKATGGVNTHKGVIYTMGIICGSIGRLWSAEVPIARITDIASECARIVGSSVAADFACPNTFTAGMQLYRKYGMKGIRGEVAAGLPSVITIGLPVYKKLLGSGLVPNDAGAITLLHLIANVKDTNLYHRGGCDGAAWAAESAQTLLCATSCPSISKIEELDNAFIARNLSPGGCADLLAVTYFLHNLES